MKAALKTSEGRFRVEDVETPGLLARDWVRARIRVAGICGTDLRHWEVEDHELEGHIMGHEMAGDVVEVGEDVTNVKVGDRVVIETVLGDDTCDWCRVRHYNVCPHLYEVRMKTVSQAFAEHVSGPSYKFYKLPDHVSYEEAAVLDTFSVCLHAQQLSGLKINDKVVVIGGGPIGLGQLQLARLSGADVLIIDPHDVSLKTARDLGAKVTVKSDDPDLPQKVKDFTSGRGADITFECAGGKSMPTTLREATDFTRRGGKVVLVGGFDKEPIAIELDWQRIQMSEIKIIPSASYAFWDIYPEMQICLDLLADGKLDAKKLITHRFPLDKINEAFETAADKEGQKAIFVAINT